MMKNVLISCLCVFYFLLCANISLATSLSMQIKGTVHSANNTGEIGDYVQVGPLGENEFDWGQITSYTASTDLPHVSNDLDQYGWSIDGTIDSIDDHTFTYSGDWAIAYLGSDGSFVDSPLETGTFEMTADWVDDWTTADVRGIFTATEGNVQPADWPAEVDWSAANPGSFTGTYYSSNSLLEGTMTAPVPEPATCLLFGTGLFGLMGSRRKKFFKKKAS